MPFTIHKFQQFFVLVFYCVVLLLHGEKTTQAEPLKLETGSDNPLKMPGATRIVYKKVKGIELAMYVYQPAPHPVSEKKPAIVFFFGGGWTTGTPKQFAPHCQYLASRGMVAIAVDYRVKSRHNVLPAACVADAKSAIRYVRKNASTLGVDPNRIVAAGGSAGGHLAAATATLAGFDEKNEDLKISSQPDALVLFNPALMLAEFEGSDILQGSFERNVARKMGIPAEKLSPIHHLHNNVAPTIIFHGQADPVVSYATVELFQKKMLAMNRTCELHGYAGQPHGFFNFKKKPAPPIPENSSYFVETVREMDRFLNAHGFLVGPASIDYFATDVPVVKANKDRAKILTQHIHLRNLPLKSQQKFAKQKIGRVAFLGGSITEMNGFRPLVCQALQEKFPETKFEFINAGIASTCSTTAAGRIQSDVFVKGEIDLLFIEEAVNDDSDAVHTAQRCTRGMEGMVRRVKRQSPQTDLVFIYFTNPAMLEAASKGAWSVSSGSHDHVATHYGISSVDIVGCLSDLIETNQMTWSEYGGVHPKKPGNQLAADMVIQLLNQTKTEWKQSQKMIAEIPALDCCNYELLHAVSPDFATRDSNWKFHRPNWKEIPGSFRSRFAEDTFLTSQTPGANLEFNFQGRGVGLYLLAGPDAGTIEYRIDGSDWKKFDLYHRHSKSLHYPRTVMLEEILANEKHHIEIRIAESKNKNSSGHSVRIMQFVVNGK